MSRKAPVARFPVKFDDGVTPVTEPENPLPVGTDAPLDVFTAYIRVSRKGVALLTSVTAATIYSLIQMLLALFQGNSLKIW